MMKRKEKLTKDGTFHNNLPWTRGPEWSRITDTHFQFKENLDFCLQGLFLITEFIQLSKNMGWKDSLVGWGPGVLVWFPVGMALCLFTLAGFRLRRWIKEVYPSNSFFYGVHYEPRNRVTFSMEHTWLIQVISHLLSDTIHVEKIIFFIT